MDFQKLVTRYKQFGGMRLAWEYFKLGTLWSIVKAVVSCGVKRQSFNGIYPEVLKRIEPFLVERYGTQIPQISQKIKANTDDTNRTDNASTGIATIWWCWLQGLDAAPPIVEACYNSLVHGEWFSVHGYEVKVIDNSNWRKYVELPGYIVEKWEKGRIPAALFSDLLRLELLIRYGGTWIDSTVLCTGFKFQDLSPKVLEADLFLFQYTKPGSVPVSISNWFISACSHNEVLMLLQEMLYAYWRDYDCVLDYYIFHLFFSMISKEYPEQILAMPYGHSQNSLVLLHQWGEKFDQQKWDKLTNQVCFHKLAFRVSDDVKNNKENYYNHILNEYGRI